MDKVIIKLCIVKCPKLKAFFKKIFGSCTLCPIMPFAKIKGPVKKNLTKGNFPRFIALEVYNLKSLVLQTVSSYSFQCFSVQ